MANPSYGFKLATSVDEVKGYFALRQRIFCQEQGLFDHTDRDETDQRAYPIIALEPHSDKIVGVVRIYEAEPGLWYGGRLGTHPDYRRGWHIGKGLIVKAVTTAHGWGCQRFLATVQLQNVRFFQRLHWTSLEQITLCDRPHHLMAADLHHYPAGYEPRPPQHHPQAS